MAKLFESELILLFNRFDEASKKIWNSFLQCGYKLDCIVFENNGFLPDGVYSIFDCFSNCKKEELPTAPLDIYKLQVPELWRVSTFGNKAEIFDGEIEKGRVGLKEYNGYRCVEYIDWLDYKGKRLYRENYDKTGKVKSRKIYMQDGTELSTVYYDHMGDEVVTEIKQDGKYIIHNKGIDKIVNSLPGLAAEFIIQYGLANRRFLINSLHHPFRALTKVHTHYSGDILFWQENIDDEIPIRLQSILNRKNAFITTIFSDKMSSYEKIMSANEHDILIKYKGYVYPSMSEDGEAVELTENDDNMPENEFISDFNL